MAGGRRGVVVALALALAAALIVSGCSSGGAKVAASSTSPGSATPSLPSAPAPMSATPTRTPGTATPTGTSAEIRGTATDFCSAAKELAVGINKGGTFDDARVVIQDSAADMLRYAPASIQQQVKAVAKGLFGIAQNLGLGVITTNELLSTSMQGVLGSANGAAVEHYLNANCH